MSSRGRDTYGTRRSFSSKGKNVELNLDSSGGSDWEIISRKPKNRSAKSWIPQNPNPGSWNHALRNNNGSGRNVANPRTKAPGHQVAPPAAIRPPLQNGWNWRSRAGTLKDVQENNNVQAEEKPDEVVEEDDYESDVLDDSDDDFLNDHDGSDSSEENHETLKQKKRYKKFFDSLDKLTVEQINEPGRQWHCPACQGGPGAIDWYGLQPLVTHANTKGAGRVKLHRELAKLLEEELRQRGTYIVGPTGETFGQWKGLKEEVKDHKIVWPPMVVIMNTKHEKDENDKWLGMVNQELLDYFSGYAASKARHSYGPHGHRGMSVLIFEGNAGGYVEAERLHRHFAEQGTDREAWDRRRVLFHGGMRQLYGFMAVQEDLDIFNQHSQGRSKLKFEMRSYQEMVVKELRQMSEDNQQLNFLKNKLSSKHKHAKALEESLDILSEKLRKTTTENHIVRQMTKVQHEQNKQEMDFQDNFLKEQVKVIYETRDAKKDKFEMRHQEKLDKTQHQINMRSSISDHRKRAEEISTMEEFIVEREKLIEEYEKTMADIKRRHNEEELEMNRELDAALSRLIDKYSLDRPDADSP